jgi:branched-chain amino acid transport system permease protein
MTAVIGIAIGAMTIPLITQSPFILHILFYLWLQIILVCSLRVIFDADLISAGHPAFMAIGAYTTSVLTMRFGVSFWATLPLGIMIAAIAAAAIGSITLKLKHVYFMLATFAFVEVVRLFFSNWCIGVFGGIPGLINIPHPNITIPYLFETKISSKIQYYYLGLVLLMLSLFILYRVEMSRLGQIFKAIGQSDMLAQSIGVNIFRYKLLAFAIGAAFAALAGSLFAPFNRLISPADFSMRECILLFAYIIVGGMKSFYGPIIGASFLILSAMLILSRFGPYESLFYGFVLLLVLIFMPQGLVSLPKHISSLVEYFGRGGRGGERGTT